MPDPGNSVLARVSDLSAPERYDLLTSLVIPRPIGWLSTRSPEGVNNLAPFSYFQALASNPPLVGVSIGMRRGRPKDTLENIRSGQAFCVNLCSEELLEAMNLTSGEYGREIDEFSVAGMTPVEASMVPAPLVLESPVGMECELVREVSLEPAPNVLVVGRVICVHLSRELELRPGRWAVAAASLRLVARLGRDQYMLPGEILDLPRPRVQPGPESRNRPE